MNRQFKKMLIAIAQENDTTPDEVYREMQIAINAAFDNPNPLVQQRWKNIHFKGSHPTPEDVIFSIIDILSSQKRTTS